MSYYFVLYWQHDVSMEIWKSFKTLACRLFENFVRPLISELEVRKWHASKLHDFHVPNEQLQVTATQTCIR
jgi:hypothetical protein